MFHFFFRFFAGRQKSGAAGVSTPELDTTKLNAFEVIDHIGKSLAACIRPGLRTNEIEAAIDSFLGRHKIEGYFRGYNGFPKVAAISINDEVVGGLPSDRKLRQGDLVKIETGVKCRGQCAYLGWTFPIGAISKKRAALLEAAQNALTDGCNAVQAGRSTSFVTRAIDASIRRAGFAPNQEYVGYQIGSNPHMRPAIPCSVETSLPGGDFVEGETYVIIVIAHAGSPAVYVKGDMSTVAARDQTDSVLLSRTLTIFASGNYPRSHAETL